MLGTESGSFIGRPPVSIRVRQARQLQFDAWLSHRLRDLYDPILDEPLPDDIVEALAAKPQGQA